MNSIRREVRSIPETKNLTAAHNLAIVGTTPYLFNMTQIGQGVADNQRIGLEVSPLKFDMYLQAHAESGDSNEHRIIVFRWFDDTAPTVNEILQSNTSGIFSGFSYLNIPTLWPTKDKYQILMDQRFTTAAGLTSEHMQVSLTKKFGKHSKITYEDSGTTSGIHGELWCMIMNDSAVVPHPTYQGYSRLLFKDT